MYPAVKRKKAIELVLIKREEARDGWRPGSLTRLSRPFKYFEPPKQVVPFWSVQGMNAPTLPILSLLKSPESGSESLGVALRTLSMSRRDISTQLPLFYRHVHASRLPASTISILHASNCSVCRPRALRYALKIRKEWVCLSLGLEGGFTCWTEAQ